MQTKMSGTPAKIYVIHMAGIEYNDETYYQEGWELANKTAFTTIEEANAAAKEALKQLIGSFMTGDFDEINGWGGMSDILQLFCDSHPEIEVGQWSVSSQVPYTEFILWCENNGYPWVDAVPDFIHVREVTINA